MKWAGRWTWLWGAAMFAFLATTALAAAADDAAGPAPARLVVWNRTITTFRATVAGVAPEPSAVHASARFAALPASPAPLAVTVRPATVGKTDGLLLAAGDHAVFGLVPGDLDPESAQSLEQAAAEASRRVGDLLAAQQSQREWSSVLRGVAWSALALVGLVAGGWLVFRLRRAAIGRLLRVFEKRRLSIGGLDLVPTLATIERATFRVVSWVIVVALAYACLTFAF